MIRAYLEDLGDPDRRWPLVRAPQSSAEALTPPEEAGMGLDYVLGFYREHIEPESLEGFMASLTDWPSLGFDDLADDMIAMAEAIYGGVPFDALLSLWGLWPDRRHAIHGRMLLSGHLAGVDDLDLYDVACLMWAELDEQAMASPFTQGDTTHRVKLRESIMGMTRRTGGSKSDVDALKALLNRKK